MIVNYFKLNSNVVDPTWGTPGSACFDLRLDLTSEFVHGFFGDSKKAMRKWNYTQPCTLPGDNIKTISLPVGEARWMLPTGLIFGIPDGYHLEVNVRGGTGLKRGLRLANSTGIIDDDYVEETFLLIQNVSGSEVILFEGERLCQAHLVKNEVTELCEVFSRPERKTVRAGGFNSTGKF